jgi:hypothetical protein
LTGADTIPAASGSIFDLWADESHSTVGGGGFGVMLGTRH